MSTPPNTKLIVELPSQTNGVQDTLTLVVAAGNNVLTQIRGWGENEYRNPWHCTNVVLTSAPGGAIDGQQIVADIQTVSQTTDDPSAAAADTIPAWCACTERTDIGTLVVLGTL